MGRAFEYRRKSKEARWDKMSKIFPKIGKAITMAAKEGGNDPVNNSKLRLEVELGLIDAGLEELEVEEGTAYAYGSFTDFGTLTAAVEALGIEIKKVSLQRIPDSPKDFTEEQINDIEVLLDKLEDDEDVQSVFTDVN